MVGKTSDADRAVLKAAMAKINQLPPMDFERFRTAAQNALRDAVAEAEAKAKAKAAAEGQG